MIRIKRKKVNPTDHELLKQITIEPEDLGSQISYKVFYDNKLIGYAKLNPSNRTPFNTITIDVVEIDSKFRRKGINTYLYDFIESDTGLKIIQSEPRYLSSDGEKFWKARNRRDYYRLQKLFGKVEND